MENKYLRLLKSLSVRELKDFRKFLRSPIFNESECYIRFYDFIKHYAPTYDSNAITKECVFHIFYPGETYCDKKLRDRLTHLLKLLKEFIALDNFRKSITT